MSDDPDKSLLDELRSEGAVDAELLERIAGAVAPTPPPANARQRLLAQVQSGGRLHRFAERVAELLDTNVEAARKYLDGIDDKANWEGSPLPDVTLFHVEGGPRVQGAITGFVRIPAGAMFPEHDHSGDEAVLIVQGRCRDTYDNRILGPGDIGRMTPSCGKHQVEALPGPPLVYLAVVFEGIGIGGHKFGPEVL